MNLVSVGKAFLYRRRGNITCVCWTQKPLLKSSSKPLAKPVSTMLYDIFIYSMAICSDKLRANTEGNPLGQMASSCWSTFTMRFTVCVQTQLGSTVCKLNPENRACSKVGWEGEKNIFIFPSLFLDLCCQTLWCIEDTRLTWGSKLASIASDKHAATNKTQYLQRFQCSGYSHSSCSVLLQNWEWRTSPTWKCDLQEGCLGCMDQIHRVKWGYRANTCIVPKAMRLKCLVDKFRLVCSYTKALEANWKQTMKPGLGTNFCLLPFTQGTTTWIDRVWERRTKPWNEHGLSSNGYQHPLV